MEDYKYKILINPSNLFKNSEEIHDFCKLAESIKDLEAFKLELIKEELFEWCSIVQKYILNFQHS